MSHVIPAHGGACAINPNVQSAHPWQGWGPFDYGIRVHMCGKEAKVNDYARMGDGQSTYSFAPSICTDEIKVQIPHI